MVTIAPEQASSTQSMPLAPEPGRIVNVRGSTWAVADVRRQGLPRSPADEGTAGLTHVVSLQSLEEDRLGEELAVVWELEVGHTVAPDQGLPDAVTADGFDDPNTLAAYVVGQLAWLDARHRSHVHVENDVKQAKDLGLNRWPSHQWSINVAWTQVVALAANLLACFRHLALPEGELRDAAPKLLRYRLLHRKCSVIP